MNESDENGCWPSMNTIAMNGGLMMNTMDGRKWTETMNGRPWADVDAQYVGDGKTRVLVTTLGSDRHGIWPDAHVWLPPRATLVVERDIVRGIDRDVLRVTLRHNDCDCATMYNVVDVVAYHVNVTMDIEYGGTVTLNDVSVSMGMDDDGYPMCRVFRDDIPGLNIDGITAFRVVMRQPRNGG